MLDLAIPLTKEVLFKLASKATSFVLDKFEKKTGQGAARAGRGFTLFISDEDMDDIIKIVESLEKIGLLIDDAGETVKHETAKTEGGFLPAMMGPMTTSLMAVIAYSLTQHVASSLINSITGKRQEGGFLPLLALPLMMKVLGKGVRRAGRGYMNKDFYFRFIL